MINTPSPEVDVKASSATSEAPQTITSKTLLGKQNQIFIVHDGQRYQLRITKQRKLILTK